MEELAAIEEQQTLALNAPKNWKLFLFPNVEQFRSVFEGEEDGTVVHPELREKTLRFASAVYDKFELTFERIELLKELGSNYGSSVKITYVLLYVNDLVFRVEERYVRSGKTIVFEDKFYEVEKDVYLFSKLCLEEVA